MRKRWIGCVVWLLLAACLYFFENNAGTRIILICSLLFPLLPPLRKAFFSADRGDAAETPQTLTVKSFISREADEPGDVRPYMPGDPVRRIHWKLSAKKDETLVRETATAQEAAEENRTAPTLAEKTERSGRKRLAMALAGGMGLCLILLLLIPEANRGAQALCNRLFAASEAVNAYAYAYFPVAENQGIWAASSLAACFLALLAALTILLRSRLFALAIMAACTLCQVYFGLSFPGWLNVPLYGLLAVWMMRRPFDPKSLKACGATVLSVSICVALLFPGADAATEAASETARDRLSRLSQQITGVVSEAPVGETETRHAHTQSLENGGREAQTGREYRLVTVEEKQISLPHWVNWLKICLLLLLAVALVVLPFTPFALLNARRKKAQEARRVFDSKDVGEAVCAIFRQVILWLEATDNGAGNRLYRAWPDALPDGLPKGYAARFARCAADFEEAAYSGHTLPEEKRQEALDLLSETETALWNAAGWRQRFRLKYWMCLCE